MTLSEKIDKRIVECLSDIASQLQMIQSYQEAKRFLRQNTFKVGDICICTQNRLTILIRIIQFNENYITGERLVGYTTLGNVVVFYESLMSGEDTLKLAKKEDMALFIGMPYKSEAFEKILRKG